MEPTSFENLANSDKSKRNLFEESKSIGMLLFKDKNNSLPASLSIFAERVA
jgi:hypothetical protein